MNALSSIIKKQIQVNGPLTVADYMTLALYHPEHGYYVKGNPVGKEGDFITSPEISQIFGELIGLWCLQTWYEMGSPTPFNLVELGPGRGVLMTDLLRAVKIRAEFTDAANIHLVESNERLQKEQWKRLSEYGPQWHAHLSEIPDAPTIIIANEFFDCLPIRQFVRSDNRWHERMISLSDDDALQFVHSPEPFPEDSLIHNSLKDVEQGSLVEVSSQSGAYAQTIAELLCKVTGRALIIDYGYTEFSTGDTLQALAQHSYEDVLKNPGDVDLTAHVNFAILAECARDQECAVDGPITQGDYLTNLGLNIRLELLKKTNPERIAELESGAQRLIDENQMGTLFKVLSLSSPDLPSAAGF